MFTWGHGNTGALGHGDNEDQPQPKAVIPFGQPQPPRETEGGEDPEPDRDLAAVSVACGAWHTVVLTTSGKVFTFGDGFTGQLGMEDRGNVQESRALSPRAVRIERNAGGSGGSPGDVFVTQVRGFGVKLNHHSVDFLNSIVLLGYFPPFFSPFPLPRRLPVLLYFVVSSIT